MANGLLSVEPPTDDTIEHYRLHDIAHLYVESKNKRNNSAKKKAVRACIAFTENHDEPERNNLMALETEILNFEGASEWALRYRMWWETQFIAINLSNSKFFDCRGFYNYGTIMLLRASRSAEQQKNDLNQGKYARFAGGLFDYNGKFDQAIEQYKIAGIIAKKHNDKEELGRVFTRIGDININTGQYEVALEFYGQALDIAYRTNNKGIEASALSGLAIVNNKLNYIEKAIDFTNNR